LEIAQHDVGVDTVHRAFPNDAKRNAGYQLRKVQKGEQPDVFKSMAEIGARVYEIIVDTVAGWFRVMYVAKFEESVYVLHSFQKKTNKTPPRRQRCREAPVRRSFEGADSKMKTTHPDADLKSRHITPADGNVFADLGSLLKNADARIAKAQRLKEEAANAIAQWIQAKKLTQIAASEILDVSRPRVSDLVNLKLGRFSLDTLVAMLLRTGKDVDLVVR
jgi:phage-related protein/predicted XRE-type DNA-binding protein